GSGVPQQRRRDGLIRSLVVASGEHRSRSGIVSMLLTSGTGFGFNSATGSTSGDRETGNDRREGRNVAAALSPASTRPSTHARRRQGLIGTGSRPEHLV